jgi:hypothetical protein
MIKDIVTDLAALVSVGAFTYTLLVWADFISGIVS